MIRLDNRPVPLTRFTLRQLEACAAVADLRSFSAAAGRLGMTAQAVSQLVAELEGLIGFRLFDRTTRRVSPTSAGNDFVPMVQTVLRHVHDAESVAADVRNRVAGVVRVGAPLVLASIALPAAIHAHAERCPKVVVRIVDMAVERLVDSVACGDVDLAFGPDRATGAEVASRPLFDSPWVLWCTPQHPLARLSRLRWSALRQQPLVAAGRDHERNVAQMRSTLPDDERVTPVEVVENISTALGIAAQGRAATLAPAYVGPLARTFGLVMRRVVEPETVRKVCLFLPTTRALSPAADGFAEHLAEWLGPWSKGRRPLKKNS
jgi:DNA-binding transcriptional LysR family regulator